MKFCFAIFLAVFLVSSVEGADLSIPGQQQILNVVYQKAFNSSSKQVMNVKDCFCNTNKRRPCYEALNNMGNELKSVLTYLKTTSTSCQSASNNFLGVPNNPKIPSSYTAYNSSDFYPPSLKSSFLVNSICTSTLGVNCIQPVNVTSTGLTSTQMANLLDAFGDIVGTTPKSLCPGTTYFSSGNMDKVSNELSRYPKSLQNLFGSVTSTACKNMTDSMTTTDFYLNVFCERVNCTFPMLL